MINYNKFGIQVTDVKRKDVNFLFYLREKYGRSMLEKSTFSSHRKWMRHYFKEHSKGSDFYYKSSFSDVCYGVFRLTKIDEENIEFGSFVVSNNRPPKFTLKTLVIAILRAFSEHGAKSVSLKVFKNNHKAISLYKLVGFRFIESRDSENYFLITSKEFLDFLHSDFWLKIIKVEVKFPNLIIPGAAKSGTTSLHEYLNQHSNINMSTQKEPHYFCVDISGKYPEYFDMFSEEKDVKYYGESSTGYLMFSESIKRVQSFSPDTKYIVCLRNPIDRLVSHYTWMKGLGYEKFTFREALELSQSKVPSFNSFSYYNPLYFHWSNYGTQIEQLLKYVPRKDLLVILFEDLVEKPNEVVNECFEFLGLEHKNNIEKVHTNKTKSMRFSRIVSKVTHLEKKMKLRYVRKERNKFLRFILHYFSIGFSNIKDLLTVNRKETLLVDRFEIGILYREEVAKLKSILPNVNFDRWSDFNE